MEKAIVLLSGGLDSVVLANYVAKNMNEELIGYFIDYGQEFVTQEFDSVIKCILGLRKQGYQANYYVHNMSRLVADKNSYNSMRNLIFISHVARFAEKNGIKKIYAGFISNEDYDLTFKDASAKFAKDVDNLLFNNFGIHFYAPFVTLHKKDIFDLSIDYEVNLEDTWSCNNPKWENGKIVPCGKCADCTYRNLFNSPVINYAKTFSFDTTDFVNSYMNYPLLEARMLINNECNLKCNHCFYDFKDTKRELMPLEVWKSIIADCVREGVMNFHFSGKEPFIDESIFNFTKHIKTNYPQCTYDVVTNGTMVKKYINQVKEAGFSRVCLSFDDFEDAKVRKFNSIEEPIKLLVENDIPVAVFVTLTPSNYKNTLDNIRHLNKLGVKYFWIKPVLMYGNAKEHKENIMSVDELYLFYQELKGSKEKIDGEIFLELKQSYISAFVERDDEFLQFIARHMVYENYESISEVNDIFIAPEFFCGKYTGQITITPDGYVLGCGTEMTKDYDKRAVGNLMDESLSDLLKRGRELNIEKLQSKRCDKECNICTGECEHTNNFCYRNV